MTPHDKVRTAISILQAHILSMDSVLDASRIWGTTHMPTPALEQAVTLLLDSLEHVPDE